MEEANADASALRTAREVERRRQAAALQEKVGTLSLYSSQFAYYPPVFTKNSTRLHFVSADDL